VVPDATLQAWLDLSKLAPLEREPVVATQVICRAARTPPARGPAVCSVPGTLAAEPADVRVGELQEILWAQFHFESSPSRTHKDRLEPERAVIDQRG